MRSPQRLRFSSLTCLVLTVVCFQQPRPVLLANSPPPGRTVFESEKARCSTCHTTDGTGGKVGPDLRGIADKLDRAGLLKALLQPSADILPGYSAVTVLPRAGAPVQGVLRRASEREIELVDANGQAVRLERAEVASLEVSPVSLMPEGLREAVGEAGFQDLVAYLETLHLPPEAVQDRPESPSTIARAAVPARLVPFFGEELALHRPVSMEPLPGHPGNYLVAEVERGRVWRVEKVAGGDRKSLFVDLHDETRHGYIEGILGIALHPRFAENRRYFVKIHSPEQSQVIVNVFERRASADGLADSGEAPRLLLSVPMPHVNHNGGSLGFGPDGYLYLGFGDGGPQLDVNGHAQNLGSLLGKILRIDVDAAREPLPYGIPSTNPFVGRPGARGEIWALGLREPWRFSFEPGTNDLWVGDVGQDRFEEVTVVRRGENHGWNVLEGLTPFSGQYRRENETYVPPVLAYSHRHGVSVTGGHVYRGARAPALRGAYIFGDFETRRIWALWHKNRKLERLLEIARAPSRIAAFCEDPDGELLLVGHDPAVAYRLELEAVDPTALRVRQLAATSEAAGILWRHTTRAPAPEWFEVGFNDSSWDLGPAGFGTERTPGAVVRTEWRSSDLWVRRTFDLALAPEALARDPGAFQLRVHHDEDCEIYLNGVRAAELGGWTSGYTEVTIFPEALRALHAGPNLLAAHCRQRTGGQYFDVGLELLER